MFTFATECEFVDGRYVRVSEAHGKVRFDAPRVLTSSQAVTLERQLATLNHARRAWESQQADAAQVEQFRREMPEAFVVCDRSGPMEGVK